VQDSLFASPQSAPLAARLRPRSLDEVAGQAHLLGPQMPLRVAIERGETGSILLWGPPGTGKTTIARLVARHVKAEFVPFSAVTDGVPRLREIVAEAEKRRVLGMRTVLFVDEIHRFNRGQQDALLPHVESGLLTLIGATTENPSFELNGALLSRLRVFVLQPLDADALGALVDRALVDRERGLGAQQLTLTPDARRLLVTESDGDARRALTVLEACAVLAAAANTQELTVALVAQALQTRMPSYDKSGEQHFNLISAYHKAMRGSDPQGALYWLARMIEGGEDPLYIARRTVRFAAEDIGLADPRALQLAIAARDAYHFLGSPEGELALAEAAVYCATAPKSNRLYTAWSAAQVAARETPSLPVPAHLLNSEMHLRADEARRVPYQYPHDFPGAFVAQAYQPEPLQGQTYYHPGPFGEEKRIAQRLAWWAERGGPSLGGSERSDTDAAE